MANYLVLGGSGFLGSRLVSRLAEDRENEIVVADLTENPAFAKYRNVHFQKTEFVEKTEFGRELEGIDTVYHLISTITPSDDTEHIWQELRDNVRPTIALLDGLAQHPKVKLIFISSGGTIYGNRGEEPLKEDTLLTPICNYGLSKEIIEKYILLYHHMYGLDYRIARLSNPYGTKLRKNQKQGLIPVVIDHIMRGQPITVFGDGRNVRDYIHVEDAISGILATERVSLSSDGAAFDRDGCIFNIGFGEGHSILQIIDMIVEELGCVYPQISFVPARKCDVEYNVLDASRIKKAAGWEACISLREGIHMMIENIRKEALE